MAAPAVYGIEADWVPCEPVPGVMAVSVNALHDVSPLVKRPRHCYSWLLKRKPDAIIGNGGTFIYDTRDDFSDEREKE